MTIRERPVFNPHPQSVIPHDVARRQFDSELAAWAAETMVEAVDRLAALKQPTKKRWWRR